MALHWRTASDEGHVGASRLQISVDDRLVAHGVHVLAVIGCLGIGVATALVSPILALIAIAALAIGLVCVLATHVFGSRGLFYLALTAASAFMAMNGLRVASWIALSDVFLAGAFLLSPMVFARRSSEGMPFSYALFGIGLLSAGAILGSLFVGGDVSSFSALIRFVFASAGLLTLFWYWAPGERNLEPFLWIWILSATISAVYALVLEPETSFVRRVVGLTTHPNHLALISVMAIGPALAFYRTKSGWSRFLAVCAICLLTNALLLSGSRAGVIGLTTTVGLFVFISRDLKSLALVAASAAALAIVIVSGSIQLNESNALQRLLSAESSSATASDAERRQKLEDSFKAVETNPITGVGLSKAREAHNIYLQVTASAGILGLAGLCIVLLSALGIPLFKLGVKAIADSPAAFGLFLSVASYATIGLFQNAIWDRYIWFCLAMNAAAMSSLLTAKSAQISEQTTVPTNAGNVEDLPRFQLNQG